MADSISTLFNRLKPDIIGLLGELGLLSGSGSNGAASIDGVLNASQYPDALLRDGTRSLLGSLLVALGATIDGVDLDVFKSDFDAHLAADSHTQYASADGSGTRNAYQAVRLIKQIIAGAGLTGGGVMDVDRTLDVGAGTGITVNANDVAVNTGHPFVWTATHENQHIIPRTNDQYDLGQTDRRWRQVFASELETILLKYKAVIAVDGQIILGKQNGTLAANVSAVATTINFGQAMTVGDVIYIAGNNAVEYVTVGSFVSGTTYNVTRNVDGSGAEAWVEGQAWICFGQDGDLRLVIEGGSNNNPKISLLMQGATYNATTKVVGLDSNGLTFAITEYTYNLLRWYVGANQAGSIGFGALGTIGVPTTQRIGHFYTMDYNDDTKKTGILAATDTGGATVDIVARNTTVLTGKSNGAIRTGGTSFPSPPANNDLHYRTDFRAWFVYDNSASAWKQVSIGSFASSFPSSPVDNLKVYREDKDELYFYNNATSKWLSVTIYQCQLLEQTIAPLLHDNANIGTSDTVIFNMGIDAVSQDVYVFGMVNLLIVATNNATNYYNVTIEVIQNDGGGTATTLLNAHSTSGYSANTSNQVTLTAGTFAAVAQNAVVRVKARRAGTTGLPGRLGCRPNISYRKVLT